MSIDFSKIRVPADRKMKITPVLSSITVGKPNKTAFIRTRTGEGFEPVEMYTYSSSGAGNDNTPYLVMEDCHALLDEMGLLVPTKFYLYIIHGSNIMKLDGVSQKTDKNGILNRYHATHMEALEAAATRWVRMHANMEGGFYTYSLAEDNLPEPEWPAKPESLMEALGIAFKGFVIDTLDHPEIKKLRGKF